MKNIQTITRLLGTVVVAVAGSLLQCEAKADHPEPVKKMLAAWRARQDAVQSGEIHWKDKVTNTNAFWPGVPGASGKPAPRTTVTYIRSLTLFADRYLYHRRGKRWSGTLEKLVDDDFSMLICQDDPRTLSRAAFDTIFRDGKHVPTATYPMGLIEKGGRGLEYLTGHEYRTIIDCIRPFSVPTDKPDSSAWKVESTAAPIEGATCVVVSRSRTGGIEERLWVEPETDYVIRKAALSNEGVVTFAYDAWFSPGPSSVQLPSRWRISSYTNYGDPEKFSECTVTRMKINHIKSAQELQLEFPVGTIVSDFSSDPPVGYILRANGQKRYIDKRDAKFGYHAIANSEPGKAVYAARRSVTSDRLAIWGLLGAAAAFAALAAFLGWKKRLMDTS